MYLNLVIEFNFNLSGEKTAPIKLNNNIETVGNLKVSRDIR